MMSAKSAKPTKRARQRLTHEQKWFIGRRIAHVREDRKLTQRELGRLTGGINEATLSQIEQGHRAPDLATLLAIADKLDVPPADLLPGRPPPSAASGVRTPDAKAAEPRDVSPPDLDRRDTLIDLLIEQLAEYRRLARGAGAGSTGDDPPRHAGRAR